MKLLFFVFSLTISFNLFSQSKANEYSINIDSVGLNDILKSHIAERYEVTNKYSKLLLDSLKINKNQLITSYGLNSLQFKPIQVYNFNIFDCNNDYLSCIDFKSKDAIDYFLVYTNSNKILYSTYCELEFQDWDNYFFIIDLILYDSSEDYSHYGNFTLPKLFLNYDLKNKVVFTLNGFSNHLFQIEDGLVYVLFYDKTVKKIELNKFFNDYFSKKKDKKYRIKIN